MSKCGLTGSNLRSTSQSICIACSDKIIVTTASVLLVNKGVLLDCRNKQNMVLQFITGLSS